MVSVISELDPADIAEACQLFERVFGQAISPAHWRWKYILGPRLGGLNVVARAASGELVGHAGVSIFPGTIQAASLSMAQVCDVMVPRSARGGLQTDNVYPRLLQALQEALRSRFAAPYTYGFAGARQFKLGIRMGYYRELQHCHAGYFSAPMSNPWRAALWAARESDWDLPRLDKIWVRRAPQLACPTVARSGAYLAWRYRDHPVNRYQLWLLTHLLRERGWFITRTMPDGQICIVDALLPEAADPARLVATLAVALAKSAPVVPPIYAWFLPSRDADSPASVIGGEFRVNQWHTSDPSPRFQPGDTDVF